MHSRPFHMGEETWALFTVYSASNSVEIDLRERVDNTFSRLISIAIEAFETHARASSLAGQLQNALRSRSLIDEAKGILMARYSVSPEEAFQRLIKRSQSENRKLRGIAADIVRETQTTQAPHIA